MSEVVPPSLAWVSLFVVSANRALGGDIVAAALEPRVDPLQWVIVLTSDGGWLPATVRGVRELLKTWSSANDAEYIRSDYDAHVFRALVALRGLGPEKKTNPFVEDPVVEQREARRLDRRRPSRR